MRAVARTHRHSQTTPGETAARQPTRLRRSRWHPVPAARRAPCPTSPQTASRWDPFGDRDDQRPLGGASLVLTRYEVSVSSRGRLDRTAVFETGHLAGGLALRNRLRIWVETSVAHSRPSVHH